MRDGRVRYSPRWGAVPLAVLLVLALSACAVREVTSLAATVTPTQLAPIIPPAPPQVFGEPCSLESRNLEFYLQTVTNQATLFRQGFDEAIAADSEGRASALLGLASIRDNAYRTPVPDCAVAVQSILTAAMDRGIDILRASLLDPGYNLTLAASEVSAMFDQQVLPLQKDLTDQLEADLQAQQGS